MRIVRTVLASGAALAAAGFVASGFAASAWAQAAPESDAGRCATLVETIVSSGAPFKAPPTVTASGPNTCTLSAVAFDAGPGVAVEIKSILIEGLTPVPGAAAPAGGKISRKIELRDVKQVSAGAAPGVAWLQDVGQTPLLVVLSSVEEVGPKTLSVAFTISGTDYGEVELSTDLTGIGSAPQPFGLPDVQPGKLTMVNLHWDSQKLLLRFAGPALAAVLGDKPDEQIAAGKVQAEQGLRAMMGQFPLVEASSVDALAGFIRDFPKPRKVLDVTLDLSAHPLSGADAGVASSGPEGAMALAKQVKLTATYAGDAD